MNLTALILGEALIVTVNETRIDAAVAIQFKDILREVTADGPSRVVLDLKQVAFLDSSGLGAIVGAKKLMGPNRKLELAGLAPSVQKVFRLTHMDTVFTIHSDATTAVETIARAS